jgi:hypothetical protein
MFPTFSPLPASPAHDTRASALSLSMTLGSASSGQRSARARWRRRCCSEVGISGERAPTGTWKLPETWVPEDPRAPVGTWQRWTRPRAAATFLDRCEEDLACTWDMARRTWSLLSGVHRVAQRNGSMSTVFGDSNISANWTNRRASEQHRSGKTMGTVQVS